MRVLRLVVISALACSVAKAQPPEPCRVLGTVEGRAVGRTADGLVAFTADMDVNTDGALQSYAVDDLGHFVPRPPRAPMLTTDHALNTICNGVNIMQRATPKPRLVYDYRHCGSLIREFERIRAAEWAPADGRYVDFYAIAQQPVPRSRRARPAPPCERDGYYVSHTPRPMDTTRPVCDPERWVDAERIAAIVVPGALLASSNVAMFDVAVVRRPGESMWHAAIVGDTNDRALGEGTMLLARRVTGKPRPGNYRETVALAPNGDFEYVVFPGSRARLTARSNAMQPAIEAAAADLIRQHGLANRPLLCR